jgi:hypothetical protein
MPDPQRLRRLTKSLAVLDAILSPEWEYRYYSYNATWAEGEEMASMRNGSGDHWFILFCSAGVALLGLDHESSVFEPGNPNLGLFEGLPEEFHENFLKEPAFDAPNSSFCMWRTVTEGSWRVGNIALPDQKDPDGSEWMLSILEGVPQQYVEFARDYYEVEAPQDAVAKIYSHAPLSAELVRSLNPEVGLGDLSEDLAEIAYPAG